MIFNAPTVVGMAVLTVIYLGFGALWVHQRGWRRNFNDFNPSEQQAYFRANNL